MNYGFEVNNPRGKWTVTLGGPIPTDEQGWQRVRRSEAIVRDALERLLSEPIEVTLARWTRLDEKAEQITFLDLLDESVQKTKAETPDSEYLPMIYDLASEYSLWVIAKYVGFPNEFLESLATGPTDKPKACSVKLVTELDQTMYDLLVRSIESEQSQSMAFGSLVQEVFKGYLSHRGWLYRAERAFAEYLNELKTQAVVTTSPTLMAPTFRDLERIKLGLREALIVCSPMLFPGKESVWRHIRSRISSDDAYLLLTKAAIWSLSCSLSEDLIKLCNRFSSGEREDEYYSYGRGDFTRKLDNRIAKEMVFTQTVKKDEDRLIYALRRGGYRYPEIVGYASLVAGKSLADDNVRQRYSRMARKLKKEWAKLSQSRD